MPVAVELLEEHGESLRGMRLLYMDCGVRDEFGLHYGARLMARRLLERHITFEHEEFDDGHMGVQYPYNVSLPRLAQALVRA